MLRPCARPRRPSVVTFLPRKYAVFPLLRTFDPIALFDGSLALYIPDRACPVRVPRGTLSVRALRLRVNVWLRSPASFLFQKFSLTPLRQPFSLSAKDFILATHRTMQYYIGPWFPTHASKGLDLGVTGFRHFALLELLTYSSDHTFSISGCLSLLDTTPHLNVMKPSHQYFSFDQTRGHLHSFFLPRLVPSVAL